MPPDEGIAARRRSHAVLIDDASSESGVPSADQIESWILKVLQTARPDAERPFEVSVRVVDRDEIRTLNRDYRQRDKITNVLSFPSGDIEGLPAEEALSLGDIVVCAPVIADEAAEQGKTPGDHWAHMLVHGTLHLLAYDHVDDGEAEVMEALEVEILGGLGVADPYT